MINIVCDICGNKLPLMGDKQNRKSTTIRVGVCGYCETMAMKFINMHKKEKPMTKAIRIENADTSDHKVTVQIWEKGTVNEDGSVEPDVLRGESPLPFPTAMVEIVVHKERYLVVKED